MTEGKIIVRISDLERSEKKENDLLLKRGKWIIIPESLKKIEGKPPHWKVEVKIIQELKRVRFGQISQIIEELTKEEKAEEEMRNLIAPLKKLGILNFPLWGDISGIGVFASTYGNSILNPALRRKRGYYAGWEPWKQIFMVDFQNGDYELDIEVAEKIWRRHLALQTCSSLLERAQKAWDFAHQSVSKVGGNLYWLISYPKKNHPRIPFFHFFFGKFLSEKTWNFFCLQDDLGEDAFEWTLEGVEAYEQALSGFINDLIRRAGEKEEKIHQRNLNLLKTGNWILGVHSVYVPWTAYHDGHGSHSEDTVASSGATEHQKKGLMLADKIGQKVNLADNKSFVSLKDDEYLYLSSLPFVDMDKMSLRKDWLIAKEERRKDLSREKIEIPLEIEDSPFRFSEILRRLDEGWVVKTRNRKTGAIENYNESVAPYDKRQDLAIVSCLRKERYKYKSYGTFGRSCMMTSTREVARKFYLYISWEEYQQLPEVRELRLLRSEANKLASEVCKKRPLNYGGKYQELLEDILRRSFFLSSFFKEKDLDFLRGYVAEIQQLLAEFQEFQEIEKSFKDGEKKGQSIKTVVQEQSSSEKETLSNVENFGGCESLKFTPFAAALLGLKK